MRGHYKYCCVDGCLNSTRNLKYTFFTLPNNDERRNEWLNVIGRSDLLEKPDLKPKSYFVCAIHFDDSMISVKRIQKLMNNAIPTKFIPSTAEYENESNVIKPDDSANDNDPSTSETYTQTENQQKNKETQTSVDLTAETPRKRKLRSIYVQETEQKKRKLEYELHKIKNGTEGRKSLSLATPNDEITKRFQKLLEWQLNLKNRYKGNRYSRQFKFLALNIHFSSPQTYRSLKSILKLPSESTLSRFKLNIRPQLDDRILNTIVSKLQSLPEEAKHCIICVDEMALKRHLYYDIRHDEVIGLHNINGNVTNELASNAYVVMLRGIAVNWKQPIAYALLASAKYYQELDDWLNEIIDKLFTMGINVHAIVSDQESTFDRYAKEIKGVTIEKPYFEHNDHKIYYIFDVPHMLKCVRNNLLTNDLSYEGNRISWDYIKTLYTHQKDKNLRLIPKITNAHIDPNNFQKLRIKYAAQTFSQSVHGALNTFIYANFLPEQARATAEFVKLLNDLFDVLNSSTINSNNKYQRAFSLNKDQIEVLERAKNMFKNITAINKVTGKFNTNKIKSFHINKATGKCNTNEIKTFHNFQISIQAIIMLSKDLKKQGLSFIYTRKLNQDPLENIFGQLRQQGDNCREPTPVQLQRAFSKLFISSMLKNSPTANCQEDLGILLLEGETIISNLTGSTADPEERTEASIMVTLDGENDYSFDLPTQNAMTYVAGYLLFKCSQKHQCPEFDVYLRNAQNINDTNMYAHFKAFNKNSSFYGRLKVPPENFVLYIKEMENCFLKHFETSVKKHPANILLLLLQEINFDVPCACFPSQFILKLFVRFRIYTAIKLNNRYIRSGKKCISNVKPL